MVWLLLAGAIVAEVVATINLRASDGFSRPLPSVVVLVGYAAAFTLLSLVLKRGMPIGIAYAVWSAVGVSLIALIGVVFLKEHLNWVQIAGLVTIVVGVAALELGGTH
jgi:small multidrug resistance pump